MKLFNRLVVVLASAFVALNLTAAVPATTEEVAAPQSLAPVTAPTSNGSVNASLEVRPTLSQNVQTTGDKNPKYTTENTVDLGYQFNPSVYLGYRQFFVTDIGNSGAATINTSPTIIDSVVRAKFKNIWTNGGTSLNYEPRLYLPFSSSLQNASHNMSLRHYFSLSQKVTNSFTVTLMEIPILHSYNQGGTVGSTGATTANPSFENRVYLLASYQFTDKLSLVVPVMFHTTRNRAFPGAMLSERLQNTLWTYPEVDYDINTTYTVGIAYYSENLIGYDATGTYTGLDINSGLEKGAAQLVLRVNL